MKNIKLFLAVLITFTFSCTNTILEGDMSIINKMGSQNLFSNPEFVYRFDTRSPEEILKNGGFHSKGENFDIKTHLLNKSNNNGFISTTKDLKVAYRFFNAHSKNGYIYTIKNIGKNRIDLPNEFSPLKNPYFYDAEVLFKKKIPSEQIHAYQAVGITESYKKCFLWGTKKIAKEYFKPTTLLKAAKF